MESDTIRLIDIGLSYIPKTCGVAKAVNVAIQSYKSGKTWQEARNSVLTALPGTFGIQTCPLKDIPTDVPVGEPRYDTPSNIGIIIIGWLYGKGDFGKSICIANNCGEDTDCTAATLGAILGILGGINGIPANWIAPIGDKITTCCINALNGGISVPQTVTELDFLSEKLEMKKENFRPNAEILCYPLLDFSFQVKKLETDMSSRIAKNGNESNYDFFKRVNSVILGENISAEKIKSASPITYVSEYTPPTFIWHTAEDDLVYVGNSINFSLKLEESGVPFELHIFEKGRHGLSLANEITAATEEENNNDAAIWPNLAERFLHRHFME